MNKKFSANDLVALMIIGGILTFWLWPSGPEVSKRDAVDEFKAERDAGVHHKRTDVGDGVIIEAGGWIHAPLRADGYAALKGFVEMIRGYGYTCGAVTRAYMNYPRSRMRCDHGMNRFYIHYRGGRYFVEAY